MRLLPIVLLAVLASACTTPVKNLAYLHNPTPDFVYDNGPEPGEYRVKSNDNLYIRVIGEDELMTAFLNITGQGNAGYSGSGYGQNTIDFITYIVDEGGTISMPQIGRVHVEGKTIREIEEMLNPLIHKYVANSSVIVRVVNRTVSVLGEVNSPGAYNMLKYRQSIFESIGMAGDLTDYGNRHNVKLVRDVNQGKQIVVLDLTRPELVTSPYYYIMPGDVIYVEPRSKLYGTKTLPFTGPLPAFMSIISSALALFAILR